MSGKEKQIEIIGWDKSKKMVYIGRCDCGVIIKAKYSELRSFWNDSIKRFDYEGRCPDCSETVSFKEMTEEEWEESISSNNSQN